jgi:hypothetical protein
MTLQSADNRHGRGRIITATVAGGVLAAGLALGMGTAVGHADPTDVPTVPNLPVDAAAIVPNGVTGEAATRASAGDLPVDPAAPAVTADPAAAADPAAPGAAPEAPPQTADEVLAIIYRDYDTGAGGGQLSTLIDRVMQLRSQGFKPSKANRDAIVEALDHRPNQGPLVQALKETLAYQTKQQQQMEAMQGSGGSPFTVGINQYDPNNPSVLGQFTVTPGS